MASVKAESNAAGDYAIGIEVEGVFIPFAQVPAHRIAHQIERRQQLEERAQANDDEAQKVLAAEFGAGKPPESEGKAKGGVG